MRSKMLIALSCMTAMLLQSCSPIGADSYCAIARPIYVAKGDVLTDLTARQIYDHNEIGAKLCEWKKHGT